MSDEEILRKKAEELNARDARESKKTIVLPTEVVDVLRRYALRIRDRERARARWGEITASAFEHTRKVLGGKKAEEVDEATWRKSDSLMAVAEKHHDVFQKLRESEQYVTIEEGNLEKVCLAWAVTGVLDNKESS